VAQLRVPNTAQKPQRLGLAIGLAGARFWLVLEDVNVALMLLLAVARLETATEGSGGDFVTDLPLWVLGGAYAGFAVAPVWAALWYLRLRRPMAEKGWKYTSWAWVLSALVFPVGSVSILLESPALDEVHAVLNWVWLATMVGAILLDAVRRTRQS
jgi:hypothetical protein